MPCQQAQESLDVYHTLGGETISLRCNISHRFLVPITVTSYYIKIIVVRPSVCPSRRVSGSNLTSQHKRLSRALEARIRRSL